MHSGISTWAVAGRNLELRVHKLHGLRELLDVQVVQLVLGALVLVLLLVPLPSPSSSSRCRSCGRYTQRYTHLKMRPYTINEEALPFYPC